MSDEEFEEYLKCFCEEINKLNDGNGKNDPDFLILDSRYFDYDENNNKYTVRPETKDLIKNALFLFVGDNPGNKEKEFLQYFYSSDVKEDNDGRRAGVKFKNSLEKIEDLGDRFIVFNKALISTDRTKYLKKEKEEKTEQPVIEFIKNITEYNEAITVVFLGFSSLNKSSVFYNLVDNFIRDEDFYILKHPVVNMLKCDSFIFASEKYDRTTEGFIKFLKDVKKHKVSNAENNNDNDGNDGNDDSDGGPSPAPVLA